MDKKGHEALQNHMDKEASGYLVKPIPKVDEDVSSVSFVHFEGRPIVPAEIERALSIGGFLAGGLRGHEPNRAGPLLDVPFALDHSLTYRDTRASRKSRVAKDF